MKKNETETRLALEIADDAAHTTIFSNSYGLEQGPWLVTKLFGADAVRAARLRKSMGDTHHKAEQRDLRRALQYMELRGKLKWHPKKPGVVKLLHTYSWA